jgi:hypothetical protein
MGEEQRCEAGACARQFAGVRHVIYAAFLRSAWRFSPCEWCELGHIQSTGMISRSWQSPRFLTHTLYPIPQTPNIQQEVRDYMKKLPKPARLIPFQERFPKARPEVRP